MAASAERIKELLGSGLSNEVVANAVGVHPSYVSQLMTDETFAAEVVEKRTQTLASISLRDRSWDGIEDKLLTQLNEIVEQRMIYKPTDVLRALALVNNAKRRGTTAQEAMVVNKTVVTLNLPTVVVNDYKKNSFGEVIEVTSSEGQAQTLVTMPAAALMQKLSEQHQGKKYDQVRKYLPASNKAADSKG